MVGCEDQIDTLEARLETLTAQVDELLYQLEDHEDEIHLVARLEGRHDWAVRLIAGLHDRAAGIGSGNCSRLRRLSTT